MELSETASFRRNLACSVMVALTPKFHSGFGGWITGYGMRLWVVDPEANVMRSVHVNVHLSTAKMAIFVLWLGDNEDVPSTMECVPEIVASYCIADQAFQALGIEIDIVIL